MSESSVACRSCGSTDLTTFLDLGETPLADALLDDETIRQHEPRFPLEVAFCPECSLVQILEEVPPEQLFVDNYLYFSSFSDVLTSHAKAHADALIQRRGLGSDSLVVELASNDGYLLRNFVEHGIPVLGIDPAPEQAEAAEAVGVPTLQEFFGVELAERLRSEGKAADVIVANNVMAHVPDLNGFVAGMRVLLADDGIATIENPYVRDLIDEVEFDTIYHEHHCYFSCTAVDVLMRRNGLSLNEIEYFPDLHGGTLRWTVSPTVDVGDSVRTYLEQERAAGITTFEYYDGFRHRVETLRTDLLALLTELKAGGARIAAYGAAAKGSTMVNYVGIGDELIDYVVDRNTHKQGRYMPGVHLPIRDPSVLIDDQPDYLLLLAWNFADEIIAQQAEYRRRGGRCIVPVPTPKIV
jgi:SAM-dependent methyltransferase